MQYDKNRPFLAAVKERFSLVRGSGEKETHHIVLDLAGSGIKYSVGDTLGIYPVHDPKIVQRTLTCVRADGTERITDKRGGEVWALEEFISCKANLTEPSKKFLQEIAARQSCLEKKERLSILLQPANREILRQYLDEREIWKILSEHPEVRFSPQELCDLAMPLLPRFYSIASSFHAAPEEVHLTVAMVEYGVEEGKKRGVCSHYLCNLAGHAEAVVPVYLQPHKGFTLPEDPKSSIIMVGPGTGIAPFRGFMQERIAKKAPGLNWLFYGGRRRDIDFFYEEEWRRYEAMGKLRCETAFSREQQHKIYVQHKLLENGKEVFEWLRDGAYFYVCGDAKRMARDVDAALHAIVCKYGEMSEIQARDFIKQLRREKRYLRDVY